MSVQKYPVKNGIRWSFRVYIKKDGNKYVQKVKRGFRTKQEAKEAEAKILLTRRNDCSVPFETMCNRYIDNCILKDKRFGTIQYKQHIISHFLLPFFKDTPTADICQAQIIAWQKYMKQEYPDLSQGYLYNINHQLFYIFDFADNVYNLGSNPARKCGSLGHHVIDHNAFWTIDDFNLFIKLLNDKELNRKNNIKRKSDDRILTVAFQLLFYAGLRISELLGLTVNDFDSEKKTLSITKQYNHNHFCDLKTKASRRTITLSNIPYDALRGLLDVVKYNTNNDRLFYLINASNLRRAIDSTCRISDLKRIRLHDLRHSCCAFLGEAEVPIKKMQKYMGHSKISTTMDYYGHVYDDDLSDVAATIDQNLLKLNK